MVEFKRITGFRLRRFFIMARFLVALISAAFMSLFALMTHAAVVAPLVPGKFSGGDGANSHWVQVRSEWRGPTYGSEAWGTGIWSIADATLIASLPPSDANVVDSLDTKVDQIQFSNDRYNFDWGPTWGFSPLSPLWRDGETYQDNWVGVFSGYIYIPEPDSYNFGVLFDDGFHFDLFGGNGQSLGIEKDGLNPRERIGFSENLDLAAGMYGYRLIAYNRLEAGVVDLSWIREGRDWQVIPKENLFTKIPPTDVPEPSTAALLGLVLVGASLAQRRKSH
jgi:PEP-CTERM motif